MQIRISRVTRNGKTYEYVQLVESYRRSDGVPTHRVVANLGSRPALEVDNMRSALAASREGKRVATRAVGRRGEKVAAPKILQNLRYLDLAVLLSLWERWRLPEVLDELIPQRDADVSPGGVVCALALQRCVDPGSKLYAAEWFPRTALPELLGIAPGAFNNTRLHRVLEQLDGVTPALMSGLVRRYGEEQKAFKALFLDVTDTWFVGHGPSMAARGKTKEGRVERKIGIVLLCSERGYPLRWQVVRGTTHDSVTMTGMVKSVSGLRWVSGVPFVCDRAMGKTAQIRELSASGMHFLTALTRTEFERYTDRLPHRAFAQMEAPGEGQDESAWLEGARSAATTHGLDKASDNLFVLDLGLVTLEADDEDKAPAQPSRPSEALRVALALVERVASGDRARPGAAARVMGLHSSVARRYRQLCALPVDVQQRVLAGEADQCTLDELIAIARMTTDAAAQCEAFEKALVRPLTGRQRAQRNRPPKTAATAPQPSPPTPLRVRLVAYFNPEILLERRRKSLDLQSRIAVFVEELNAGLASPRSRRSRDAVAAAVDRELRQVELLDAYDVSIDEQAGDHDRPVLRVTLTRRAAEWARRRRYDGFTVLVAHPSLEQEPAALCQLYRDKDAVEKDFQVIKSLVELRPIRHHTDAKVRAHVTLCMLALLLERTLRHHLGSAASAALERLQPCHLNRYQAGDHVVYAPTQLDDPQRRLLKTLGLSSLGNHDAVAERIAPRATGA